VPIQAAASFADSWWADPRPTGDTRPKPLTWGGSFPSPSPGYFTFPSGAADAAPERASPAQQRLTTRASPAQRAEAAAQLQRRLHGQPAPQAIMMAPRVRAHLQLARLEILHTGTYPWAMYDAPCNSSRNSARARRPWHERVRCPFWLTNHL